jgi:hypothetical protein
MQERNIAQRLLQKCLRLLRLLSQEFYRPCLLLPKQLEEQIEKLILGHTGHAFELTLRRLLFRFLGDSSN